MPTATKRKVEDDSIVTMADGQRWSAYNYENTVSGSDSVTMMVHHNSTQAGTASYTHERPDVHQSLHGSVAIGLVSTYSYSDNGPRHQTRTTVFVDLETAVQLRDALDAYIQEHQE